VRRLAPVLLLLACAGGADTDGGARATAPLEPTTRDSAGVTIHEHPADALERAPRITLASDPIQVHVGSVNDEGADVSLIGAWTFVGNGDLVGYDRSKAAVAVFPASGGNRWTVGRQGSGPGEFQFVSAFAVAGDTAFAWDANVRRVTPILGRQGVLPGERAVPGGDGAFHGRGPRGDLYFLTTDWAPEAGATTGYKTITLALRRLDPGADSFTTLGPIGTMEIFREIRQSGPGVAMTGRATYYAPMHQVTTWGEWLISSSAAEWRLDALNRDGALASIIRVDVSPVVLTDARWKEILQAEVAAAIQRDSTADPAETQRRLEPDRRPTLPAFSQVVTTSDGTAWAIDYRTKEQAGWAATAFDREGRILGRIVEASGDPPVAIGNDRMAFRTEDELGIATVTVRRIVM